MYCNINDSHFCQHECKDKLCGKVSIIKIILSTGDKRKINNFSNVLSCFDLKIKDYT